MALTLTKVSRRPTVKPTWGEPNAFAMDTRWKNYEVCHITDGKGECGNEKAKRANSRRKIVQRR